MNNTQLYPWIKCPSSINPSKKQPKQHLTNWDSKTSTHNYQKLVHPQNFTAAYPKSCDLEGGTSYLFQITICSIYVSMSNVTGEFQQTILRRNLPSTRMPFEALLSSNLLRYRSNDLLKDGNIATKDEGVQACPPSKVKDYKFQESMKTPGILSTWVSFVDLQCLLMEGSYIQHSRTTCNMYRFIS